MRVIVMLCWGRVGGVRVCAGVLRAVGLAGGDVRWGGGEGGLTGKVVFIFVGSYFGVYVTSGFFFSNSYCSGRFAAMA
jgi:hypothetical protein